MRLATVFAAALVVLVQAACDPLAPRPPPSPVSSPPPTTDLTVGSPADQSGSFFMAPGKTLLVELPSASSHDPTVLTVAGHYPNATLFKAAGVGRTWVIADYNIACPTECNPPAPLKFAVVVVSDEDLHRAPVLSEQDQQWIIHLRSGQRFVVSLRNRPGMAWADLTSANPAVIVPEQPAVVSADGIRGQFRAGKPGRTGVFTTASPCLPAAGCAQPPYASFTFIVFS